MNEFFSCDWGTTSFRLRRVNATTGAILQERRDGSGVRALFSSCPAGNIAVREETFSEFLKGQLLSMIVDKSAAAGPMSVFVSGMASSSVGWRELPYAKTPVDLLGTGLAHAMIPVPLDPQHMARVFLISGVRTDNDIMRGEETEILGLFANGQHATVAADGLVLLPGTHSKHVRLQEGKIVGFDTCMTGELFDVLATQSLLRASVQASDDNADFSGPEARQAFLEGVRDAATIGLTRGLFQTRVRTVLNDVRPAVNRWFLSGLLIGSELLERRQGARDLPVLLAATEPLSSAYALAWGALGAGDRLVVVPPMELETACVAAHRVLFRRWTAQTRQEDA